MAGTILHWGGELLPKNLSTFIKADLSNGIKRAAGTMPLLQPSDQIVKPEDRMVGILEGMTLPEHKIKEVSSQAELTALRLRSSTKEPQPSGPESGKPTQGQSEIAGSSKQTLEAALQRELNMTKHALHVANVRAAEWKTKYEELRRSVEKMELEAKSDVGRK